MELGELANPFSTWATLAGDLRDRFVGELGGSVKSPYAGELLGSLAALATRCVHIGQSLEQLRLKDPAAFDAFLRALEKS